MIIYLDGDEAITTAVQIIAKQRPNETVCSFNQFFMSSIYSLEKDQSFPKELTFIAHGAITDDGDVLFGAGTALSQDGMSAETFASNVKNMLLERTDSEKYKNIKKTLTHINLFGCNVGLVKDINSSSFADRFTKKILGLQKHGFNEIQVNAVSNLSLDEPYPADWLFIGASEVHKNSFLSFIIRTKEDYQSWIEAHKNATPVAGESDLIYEKLGNITKIKAIINNEIIKYENELSAYGLRTPEYILFNEGQQLAAALSQNQRAIASSMNEVSLAAQRNCGIEIMSNLNKKHNDLLTRKTKLMRHKLNIESEIIKKTMSIMSYNTIKSERDCLNEIFDIFKNKAIEINQKAKKQNKNIDQYQVVINHGVPDISSVMINFTENHKRRFSLFRSSSSALPNSNDHEAEVPEAKRAKI